MIFLCFDVHLTLWCCFSSSLVRCWCCSLLLSAFCLWHLSSSCSCFSLCSAPDACHGKTYAALYLSFALYDTSDIRYMLFNVSENWCVWLLITKPNLLHLICLWLEMIKYLRILSWCKPKFQLIGSFNTYTPCVNMSINCCMSLSGPSVRHGSCPMIARIGSSHPLPWNWEALKKLDGWIDGGHKTLHNAGLAIQINIITVIIHLWEQL